MQISEKTMSKVIKLKSAKMKIAKAVGQSYRSTHPKSLLRHPTISSAANYDNDDTKSSQRRHKLRIAQLVELCIPDHALDLGTMAMATQIACDLPGCPPQETYIVVVFPEVGGGDEILPGLPESTGGTYKTRIPKPMARITMEDVCNALPQAFIGGRRNSETMYFDVRDAMLGRITYLFDNDDSERRLVSEYLIQCLRDYIDNGCASPGRGERFPFTSQKRELVEGVSTKLVANEKDTIEFQTAREESAPQDDQTTENSPNEEKRPREDRAAENLTRAGNRGAYETDQDAVRAYNPSKKEDKKRTDKTNASLTVTPIISYQTGIKDADANEDGSSNNEEGLDVGGAKRCDSTVEGDSNKENGREAGRLNESLAYEEKKVKEENLILSATKNRSKKYKIHKRARSLSRLQLYLNDNKEKENKPRDDPPVTGKQVPEVQIAQTDSSSCTSEEAENFPEGHPIDSSENEATASEMPTDPADDICLTIPSFGLSKKVFPGVHPDSEPEQIGSTSEENVSNDKNKAKNDEKSAFELLQEFKPRNGKTRKWECGSPTSRTQHDRKDNSARWNSNSGGDQFVQSFSNLTSLTDPLQRRAIRMNLKDVVAGVMGSDPSKQAECTAQFRILLRDTEETTRQDIINTGVIPRLVLFLQRHHDPTLQLDAAWTLTKVLSGTTEEMKAVTSTGAITLFVSVLSSPHYKVRKQAIYALGNIAGKSTTFRDLVLQSGALQPLLQQLDSEFKISALRNAARTLRNLCRGKPDPDFEIIRPALAALTKLIGSYDEEVLQDSCLALSYLSTGPLERIQAIIEAGVCDRVVELLSHPSTAIQIPVLRIVGKIVAGSDEQTQLIIDNNEALPGLLALLASPKDCIRRYACWILSNIAAGSDKQIQSIIETNLVPPLIELMQNILSAEVRMEASWAIVNSIRGATPRQVDFFIRHGCVASICGLLRKSDDQMTVEVLECLLYILNMGDLESKATGLENRMCGLITQADGLAHLKILRLHPSHEIRETSTTIIKTFFESASPVGGSAFVKLR